MRIKKWLSVGIIGVSGMSLMVPAFTQVNEPAVSIENKKMGPSSTKANHWANHYIDQLSKNYDVTPIFKNKGLNDAIKAEDLQSLVRVVIDETYEVSSDVTTREVAVYELTQLWAKKTNQELETLPVIRMLIYSDTEQIDSKYNHGIIVAYMKKIAKGNAEGIFAPKAKLTYGQLAALVYNTDQAIKEELRVSEEPVMKEGFETRGDYKLEEDKVVFDFELVSHYEQAKEVNFSSGQQFEISVTNEAGEEVYRYSDDKFFTEALISKVIQQGETIKWQDEWQMTNKKGEKLTSGKYKAQIKILLLQEDGKEAIEENQLTTDIDFQL